jgi:hypothetical protein
MIHNANLVVCVGVVVVDVVLVVGLGVDVVDVFVVVEVPAFVVVVVSSVIATWAVGSSTSVLTVFAS